MQHEAVAMLLLSYNADPNKASRNGWTALIEACRVGHVGLATTLIEKGAIVDQTNVMVSLWATHS